MVCVCVYACVCVRVCVCVCACMLKEHSDPSVDPLQQWFYGDYLSCGGHILKVRSPELPQIDRSRGKLTR